MAAKFDRRCDSLTQWMLHSGIGTEIGISVITYVAVRGSRAEIDIFSSSLANQAGKESE